MAATPIIYNSKCIFQVATSTIYNSKRISQSFKGNGGSESIFHTSWRCAFVKPTDRRVDFGVNQQLYSVTSWKREYGGQRGRVDKKSSVLSVSVGCHASKWHGNPIELLKRCFVNNNIWNKSDLKWPYDQANAFFAFIHWMLLSTKQSLSNI